MAPFPQTFFEVTLKDRTVERIAGADAYQQEGQMTTFFRTDDQRRTVDSWSVRVASFRTAELLIVRRFDAVVGAADHDGGDHAEGADVTPIVRRSA